jgi:predicted lysophospholipase L1 biosynthesis ABC-type transport system permease subunit
VVNLHRVRELPLLGLVIAGAMGTIVLVYTLAVGRRGRLRDLAVLRTLGRSSAQLRRSTAWEGLLVAGAIVAVGLPIGFVAGRAVWREFADGLGVAAGPISGWLLLVIPLCATVAIVAASHSARRARRASVATLLHVE